MIRRLLISIFVLILASSMIFAADEQRLKYGIGTDITTYFAKGYSIYLARTINKYELNIGYTRSLEPDWMLVKDINEVAVEHFYILLKYNFGENVKRLYFGLGGSYVISDVEYEIISGRVEFRNVVIYASIGYNISLSQNIRLIPSLQAGFIVAGDKQKTIDGIICKIENYGYGGSIGLSYYF